MRVSHKKKLLRQAWCLKWQDKRITFGCAIARVITWPFNVVLSTLVGFAQCKRVNMQTQSNAANNFHPKVYNSVCYLLAFCCSLAVLPWCQLFHAVPQYKYIFGCASYMNKEAGTILGYKCHGWVNISIFFLCVQYYCYCKAESSKDARCFVSQCNVPYAASINKVDYGKKCS